MSNMLPCRLLLLVVAALFGMSLAPAATVFGEPDAFLGSNHFQTRVRVEVYAHETLIAEGSHRAGDTVRNALLRFRPLKRGCLVAIFRRQNDGTMLTLPVIWAAVEQDEHHSMNFRLQMGDLIVVEQYRIVR